MPALGARIFGRTPRTVTRVGLGGEGVLRTYGRHVEARAVIHEAIAQGITYFDSAKAYAGSEEYYGEVWRDNPDIRRGIFQASKSASRSREGAEIDLFETLQRLGIDVLDLWQIHDVRTFSDLRDIEAPGGALEAFVEAKETDIVGYIGVTGHHDPDVLTHAVENWPVDAVMMPVNPVEGALGGFLDTTLPTAEELGIAVIGMKVLGASSYIVPDAGVTPDLLVRYALSQGITVAIVGCSTPAEVRSLAGAGEIREPMTDDEKRDLVEVFRPYARELAYYRGAV
jgi:aryl-alcohol dehydrogenase-like predicted oxidoreductase